MFVCVCVCGGVICVYGYIYIQAEQVHRESLSCMCVCVCLYVCVCVCMYVQAEKTYRESNGRVLVDTPHWCPSCGDKQVCTDTGTSIYSFSYYRMCSLIECVLLL